MKEELTDDIVRKIVLRFGEIFLAAVRRKHKGEELAVELGARFRLQDVGAVQFQIVSAVLEEAFGTMSEDVVEELLRIGLSVVLEKTQRLTSNLPPPYDASPEPDFFDRQDPRKFSAQRTLN